MSEHMLEPWKLGHDGDVFDAEGQPVGLYRPHNKPRIVACVNACAGIETGTLEKGGEGWMLPIITDFVEDTATASENVKRMYDCATANKERADEAEALLATLAEDEKQYRHNHDHYGPSDLRTGNSWDHMRRSGDKARAFLEAKP